jgi:hypothetical protein
VALHMGNIVGCCCTVQGYTGQADVLAEQSIQQSIAIIFASCLGLDDSLHSSDTGSRPKWRDLYNMRNKLKMGLPGAVPVAMHSTWPTPRFVQSELMPGFNSRICATLVPVLLAIFMQVSPATTV